MLKEEDDDLMMLLPSQWMQRHNQYYARPTTHTVFPNLHRKDEIEVAVEEATRLKSKEDLDIEAFSMRNFPSHLKHYKRFFVHTSDNLRIYGGEERRHWENANPNISEDRKKMSALLVQIHKNSIADWKPVIIPKKVDPRPREGLPPPFYIVCENRDDDLPNDGKCHICLEEAHNDCQCPYENFCPIGTQIGDAYIIACKHCHRPLSLKPLHKSSCCARQEGYAKRKIRFKRGPWGDQMAEDSS